MSSGNGEENLLPMTTELIRKLKVLSDATTACTKCELHATRTQAVFARGNPEAKLIIVAEAPGQDEDIQGYPLVGRSGQLLDKAIKELGRNPQTDVYVCNIIKCRPPNNRKPTSKEIQSCYPYIESQIDLLPAPIIITLGTVATQSITDKAKPITLLRGQQFPFKKKTVIGAWHPSYVLRNGGEKSEQYQQFKSDLKLAFELSEKL